MIKTFGNSKTEKIYNGEIVKGFDVNIQKIARRKLRMISNSQDINDLKTPPGNKLEQLKGKRKGYYSIRINNKWRICFKWKADNAYDVCITDYH